MRGVNTYAAIAEPHRRQVLDLLRGREHSVSELVELIGLSQPGVSKHLKALREADLVQVRHHGKERRYRLHAEPMQHVDSWLAPYRDYWVARLDALESHLANDETSRSR
jgi:DNA-binding transcriptional ArsR family regulator